MKPILNSGDSEVQVWPSYTDVVLNVTLILLFYLFAQSVISSQASAGMLEVRQRQKQLQAKVEASLPAVSKNDVTISADGSLQKYTFADRILFDSGKAVLKPQGEEILGIIGRAFQEQVGTYSKIQIEGHTDDQPITVGFPSNWELSSARATSVVRFLQDHCGIRPEQLSATGYSQYHPIDSRSEETGRARNRRIEIVVVYSVQDILNDAKRGTSQKAQKAIKSNRTEG